MKKDSQSDAVESVPDTGKDEKAADTKKVPIAPVVKEEPKAPIRNHLRELRIENMMSKAELARKAGLSVLTVTRIENGFGCRMDTKRKILKALGIKVADRRKVFEDD